MRWDVLYHRQHALHDCSRAWSCWRLSTWWRDSCCRHDYKSLQYDVECVWCSFSALVWTVPCCTCRLLVIINWIININWTLYSQQNSTPYTYSIFEDWTNQRLTSIPYFNYSETVWTTEFKIRQSTSSKLLYLNPVLKAAHCYEKQLVPIVCMFIFLFRLFGLWTINSELLVYQQLKNVKLNPYNKLIK